MATEEQLDAGEQAIVDALGFGPPIKGFDIRACAGQVWAVMQALAPPAPPERKVSVMTLRLDTADLQAVVADFTRAVEEFKALLESAQSEETPE